MTTPEDDNELILQLLQRLNVMDTKSATGQARCDPVASCKYPTACSVCPLNRPISDVLAGNSPETVTAMRLLFRAHRAYAAGDPATSTRHMLGLVTRGAVVTKPGTATVNTEGLLRLLIKPPKNLHEGVAIDTPGKVLCDKLLTPRPGEQYD